MREIIDLAIRSGVFAHLWCPEGNTPAAVIIELDGRQWAVYPDPAGGADWVVAMCEEDGQPIAGTQLWMPVTDNDPASQPITNWWRFLAANGDLPDTWHNRRAPLPDMARTSARLTRRAGADRR